MTKDKKKKKGLFSSLKNAFSGKSSKKDENQTTASENCIDDTKQPVEGAAGESSGVSKQSRESKSLNMDDGLNSAAKKEQKTEESAESARRGNQVSNVSSSSPPADQSELTLDLDAVGDDVTNHLSNDAALHKLAVAPKQKHPPSSPRTRSRVLDDLGSPTSATSHHPTSPAIPTPQRCPDSADNDLWTTRVHDRVDETNNAKLTNGVLLLEENNYTRTDKTHACGDILINPETVEKPKLDQTKSNNVTSNYDNQIESNNHLSSSSSLSEKPPEHFKNDCSQGDISSPNRKYSQTFSPAQAQQNASNTNNNNNNNTINNNKNVNKTPEIFKKSPTASRIPERRHSKIPKLPPSGNSLDSPLEKKSPVKTLAPLSVAPSPQNASISSTCVTKSQPPSLINKSGDPSESSGNSASGNPGYYIKSSNSASGIPKLVAKSGIPRPRDSKEPEDPSSLGNTTKAKSSESISQQFRGESFEYKRKGSLKSQIPKLAVATHIA